MGQLVVRLILATALAAVTAVTAAALVLHVLGERDRLRADAEADLSAVVGLVEVTADEEDLRRGMARTAAGRDGRLAVHLGSATIGASRYDPDPGSPAEVPVDGGTVLLRPVAGAVVEVFLPSGSAREVLPLGAAALLAAWSVSAGVGALRTARRLRAATDDLGRLTAEVYRIGVTEPAPTVTVVMPVPETALLAAALDGLAGRFAASRDHERRLTADLSHRLRTPLTALALDVGALGDDPAAEDVRRTLATLNEEIDRLIRTTPTREFGPVRSDVVAVVARRMEFWSALAQHSGRPCTVTLADPPATINLSEDDLAALVDGLVGNVFRYTPAGTALAVTVVSYAGWITLVVDDAGPGVANPERALRRGGSGSGSTGLGLDIARTAVTHTGGTIHVERSALGGARIRLRFGEVGAEHTEPDEPRAWRLWGAS